MNDTASDAVTIRRLTPAEIRDRADEIADIMLDAVSSGAPFTIRNPFKPLDAVGWTLDVADEAGRRMVFAAEAGGRIVGMVQMVPAGLPRQPHRADVVKLVVHRSARGRGIGRALMAALEGAARETGVPLLTVETAVESDGRGLYTALGWEPAGMIPGYSLSSDGRPTDSQFFFKRLS